MNQKLIDKRITLRFSDTQMSDLERISKELGAEKSATLRMIFDDWTSRKEHTEARLLEQIDKQNKRFEDVIFALRTVFASTISTKEEAYWQQEEVIKIRKGALVLFDQIMANSSNGGSENV
ncbi:hypothetical protein M2125_001005 [Polynucleobacter sphagniphilus]|uniref:hypothetical protein n=1 Tax=Polynucleobacter sphagniphilus TaxID=1743169 RepID=UPI0024741920|nr:hypothetical protein [Polynucleobacter sphagniphilus]MDH6241198.1 hypothetical protein [Polynucleobacter sphagniphilus]